MYATTSLTQSDGPLASLILSGSRSGGLSATVCFQFINHLADTIADAAGMAKQKAKRKPNKAANKEQVGLSAVAGPTEAAPAPKGKKRKVNLRCDYRLSACAVQLCSMSTLHCPFQEDLQHAEMSSVRPGQQQQCWSLRNQCRTTLHQAPILLCDASRWKLVAWKGRR